MACCAACGESAGLLGRRSMTNGTVLCSRCSKKVRNEHQKSLLTGWNVEDYKNYLQFREKAEARKNIFAPDVTLGTLLIDTAQKLFCVLDNVKADFRKADIDIYSFDEVRYVDFPLVLSNFTSQLFSSKKTLEIRAYITFAMKDRCITVSKEIGLFRDLIDTKKMEGIGTAKNLNNLYMTMVLFVGLVKASQADMAAAWDETDYVIKSNKNGFNLENKFLWYSIDDSKELERAKSLFQVDEVNIGDIHELIEKAVKLLAIVADEKDSGETERLKRKIFSALQLLLAKALCRGE